MNRRAPARSLFLPFALMLAACSSGPGVPDGGADAATPDLAMPDLSAPDLAMPDLRTLDLAMPDLSAPDLAMPDLGLVCVGGTTRCDDQCANLQTDNAHCGACGNACPAGTMCSTGTCGLTCGGGTTQCDDACVDTRNDPTHCGACDMVCSSAGGTPSCVQGACQIACATGRANCDSSVQNGCETDTNTVASCGGCGRACSANHIDAACAEGSCETGTCATGWADCDGYKRLNGCETDITTAQNCGGCGIACSANHVTPQCTGGACAGACLAGFADCNGNKQGDGCECDLAVAACDGDTCRLKLGRACGGNGDCLSGACCGVCVDAQGDVANCGGCGVACSTDHCTPACSAGACRVGSCETGWADCDGDPQNGCEYDTARFQTDPAHCGGCGIQCASNQRCIDGTCAAVVDLAAGYSHTCALLDDGSIQCWGGNTFGQLGDGTTTDRSVPTPVVGLPPGSSMSQLTAGQQHTCATAQRPVRWVAYCWGDNSSGQLGTDTVTHSSPLPLQQPAEGPYLQVAAGGDHTCGVGPLSVACWGGNRYGQLGDGTFSDSTSPRHSNLGYTTLDQIQVVADQFQTCALLGGGTVSCTGLGLMLGDGSEDNQPRSEFDPVSGLSEVVQIAAGFYHTCAVLADGSVQCWGDNSSGQLGEDPSGNLSRSWPYPQPIQGFVGHAVQVAIGEAHTCALLDDGAVQCWGWNTFGQLGNGGSPDSYTPPTLVPHLEHAIRIAAGEGHTCALLADGSVRCWGWNNHGQIGDGTTDDRPSPTPVVWP